MRFGRISLLMLCLSVIALHVHTLEARPGKRAKPLAAPSDEPKRVWSTRSNLHFAVANNGVVFSGEEGAGLFWPRTDPKRYIFGAGVWFGAKKRGNIGHDTNTIWSHMGAAPDSVTAMFADRSSSSIYLGTIRTGILRRGIGDTVWTRIGDINNATAIALHQTGKLLIGARTGLYAGNPAGPFTKVEDLEVRSISHTGFVVTNDGKIYKPNATATNWVLAGNFAIGATSGSIFSMPGSYNMIATANIKTLFSSDGGSTWLAFKLPAPYISGVAIGSDQSFIVLSNNGKLYYSTDVGDTWMETTITSDQTVALSSSDGKTFAVSTRFAVYYATLSELKAGSWRRITSGLGDTLRAHRITTDPTGLHLAVAKDRGIVTTWKGLGLTQLLREVAEITYSPTTGLGWFAPGEWKPAADGADQELKYRPYASSSFDANNGAPMIIDTVTPTYRWPIWNIEKTPIRKNFAFGTFVSDVRDRDAHAQAGQKPVFILEEDIVVTATDRYTPPDYEYLTPRDYPLGLDIKQSVYSWGFGRYRDIVYVRYELVNTSDDTLYRCYLGMGLDPDVTEGSNHTDRNAPINAEDAPRVQRVLGGVGEYQRFLVDPLRLRMGYQQIASDQPDTKGAVAFALVETPVVNSTGEVLDISTLGTSGGYGAGSLYASNQLPLTGFRNWTALNDPPSALARYDFLSSSAMDRASETRDLRVLLSTGSFTFLPGAHTALTLAVAVANGTTNDHDSDLDSLIRLMAFAHTFFASPSTSDPTAVVHFAGAEPSRVHQTAGLTPISITVSPNPAQNKVSVHASDLEGQWTSIDILDVNGKVILRTEGAFHSGAERLNISSLPSGTYLLRLRSADHVGHVWFSKED